MVDYHYFYVLDLNKDTRENIFESAVCVSKCPLKNETIDCVTTTFEDDCNKAYKRYDTELNGFICTPTANQEDIFQESWPIIAKEFENTDKAASWKQID